MLRGHGAPPLPRTRSTSITQDIAADNEPLARSQPPDALPFPDAPATAAGVPPKRITRSRSASLAPKIAGDHVVSAPPAADPAAVGAEPQQLQGNGYLNTSAASIRGQVQTQLKAPVPVYARPSTTRRAAAVLASECGVGIATSLVECSTENLAGSIIPETSDSAYVAEEAKDDSVDGDYQTVTEETVSEVEDPVELLPLSARVPSSVRAPAQQTTVNSSPT